MISDDRIDDELLIEDEEFVPLDQELLELAASDGLFFSETFFPKTVRQGSSPIHADMWELLEDPTKQYLGMECFRGSAKTTLARIFTLKRVAFQVSRTIFYTSVSQDHAMKSIQWIKRQIDYNTKLTETFHLSRGDKWSETEIKIKVQAPGEEAYFVTIIAVGITGQIRGVNIEDYRPDLIVVDDPCDEENTNTEEQRKKIKNLFFGGLLPGLAPRTESPTAKMVLLQTCLAKGDLIDIAHKNSLWHTVKFSILDKHGQSIWPERFPTKSLFALKASFIENGQLSVWNREYECRLTSEENACFNITRLQFWDEPTADERRVIVIDPASSEDKKASKQAILVLGTQGPKVFVREYFTARGMNPEETSVEFFRMCRKWNPQNAGVESIAYQRILAWYLRNKMVEYNYYICVHEIQDRRKKWDRIRQAITARVFNGYLYIHPAMTELRQDLEEAPEVQYPDLLDCLAMGIDLISPVMGQRSGNVVDINTAAQRDVEEFGTLDNWRLA